MLPRSPRSSLLLSLKREYPGYKEFIEYLEKQEAESRDQVALSTDSPQFKQALEEMKLGTRQYARRQIKWIRNKLLPVIEACNSHGDSSEVYLYLLDATCKYTFPCWLCFKVLSHASAHQAPNDWAANVKEPAERILRGE